jgi:hypothetical protein
MSNSGLPVVACANFENKQVTVIPGGWGYSCPLCEETDTQPEYYENHAFIKYAEAGDS